MKHPQFILALSKSRFGTLPNPFNPMSFENFLKRAESSLIVSRREELELDESYGQILPYIVLWQRNPANGHTSTFVYQRGKGIGEARLLGNFSVGVGGHVDLLDVVNNASVVDLPATLAKAIRRELIEEILFKSGETVYTYESVMVGHCVLPKFVGVINDDSNAVGRVHYGLLYTHEVPFGFEPYCREPELKTIGLREHEQFEGVTMENWSEIVIDRFEQIKKEL